MAPEKEQQLKEITDQIVRQFQPEKIILFGSQAWGRPNENSDFDLLVIKETENTRDFRREVDGSIFPRPFPIDILAYRPARFEARLKSGDFFLRDIVTKGRVLYAK